MAWVYLLMAAALEVVFVLATKASHGFTELWPTLLVFILVGPMEMFCLSTALKAMEVSVGYTVWTGISSVGAVAAGSLIFHESLNPWKVLGFALVIGGVVGLAATSKSNTNGSGTAT